MSQVKETNQEFKSSKEMILTISRYGQIIGNYRSFDDVEIICKDMMVKGVPFVVSCNFIQ